MLALDVLRPGAYLSGEGKLWTVIDREATTVRLEDCLTDTENPEITEFPLRQVRGDFTLERAAPHCPDRMPTTPEAP